MRRWRSTRRDFLSNGAVFVGGGMASCRFGLASGLISKNTSEVEVVAPQEAADYTLRIGAAPVEIGKKEIVSAVTYNGQFPGPLLRFKEGQPTVVDVHNDTDRPEQLHWHGQFVSTDIDGAEEEGTPFIAAHGMRRFAFKPKPAGFRFYHTHNHAGGICMLGSTVGRSEPSTSNLGMSRGISIAKYFW